MRVYWTHSKTRKFEEQQGQCGQRRDEVENTGGTVRSLITVSRTKIPVAWPRVDPVKFWSSDLTRLTEHFLD